MTTKASSPAAVAPVEGARRGGEVGGVGHARDVGRPAPVHGDAVAICQCHSRPGRLRRARAEPDGIDLDHEGIVDATVVASVEGARRGGEVGGLGHARDVGRPAPVHGDAIAHVLIVAPAQEGGVGQRTSRRSLA